MFRKSKRIAELEAQLINKQAQVEISRLDLNRANERHEDTTTKLVRDLREMDQLVYQMVQTIEPAIARSALQRAWAITEKRMQAESKRINDLLIPEVVKTYANHPTQLPAPQADQIRIAKGKP